jgi:hypothetical protein
MPLRKIPAGFANPAQRAGRAGGVCFLCARFLCTSKERWLAPSQRETLFKSTSGQNIEKQSPWIPAYAGMTTEIRIERAHAWIPPARG